MTVIPPKSGHAFTVKRGEFVRITDIEGSQVADFICIKMDDYGERLSQGNTRVDNGTVRITTGHKLYSNLNNVMFTIVQDTVGMHDILYSPCNNHLYENVFNVGPRSGCFENLGEAIEEYGIDKRTVPDPFNVFMHTDVDEEYKLSIKHPESRPGDYVELRAEMDALIAVSSCAEDISACNGGHCTPIRVEVYAR